MRLVDWLTYERGQYRDHGLYYNTQVLFAYHANRMAGSTLTPAQISLLFVTGSLRPERSHPLRTWTRRSPAARPLPTTRSP